MLHWIICAELFYLAVILWPISMTKITVVSIGSLVFNHAYFFYLLSRVIQLLKEKYLHFTYPKLVNNPENLISSGKLRASHDTLRANMMQQHETSVT